MKKALKEYWPTGIALIILGILYCSNINKACCLAIFNDEFGYWGNAAALSGKDWSSLLAQTPYYSMGYSLLLIPLFKLGLGYSAMYRIAILMNMGFVCVSYFCALYISFGLFSRLNGRVRQLICFISAVSGTMLFNSQIAWCETFITMLFWCIVACFVRLERKWSYIASFGIIALVMMSYLTHQRTILIIPVAIGLLILICIKNKKYMFSGCVIVITVLCLIGYRYIHNIQVDFVYGASEISNINNVEVSTSYVGGYLDRLLENIGQIAVSFFCKIGIVMLSSFFTLYIALKGSIKKILKNNRLFWVTRGFILLSAATMVTLSSLQMFGTGRKDLIVYSRYMDFALPEVTLLGLCELMENETRYRKAYMLSILTTVPVIILTMFLIDKSEEAFNLTSSPIWAALVWIYGDNNIFTIGWMLIELSLMILLVFFLLDRLRFSFKKNAFLCVLIIASLCIYHYSNEKTNDTRMRYTNRVIGAYEGIMNDPSAEVYCIIPRYDEIQYTTYQTKLLQSMLIDRPITILDSGRVVDGIKDGSLIVSRNRMQSSTLLAHCEPLYTQTDHYLYRYHSGIYVSIDRMSSQVEVMANSEYLQSKGEKGIVAYSLYEDLEPGEYYAELKIQLLEAKKNAGTIRVISKDESNQLFYAKIGDYVDDSDMVIIPVRFSVNTSINHLQISISEYKGTIMRIYPYTIKKELPA